MREGKRNGGFVSREGSHECCDGGADIGPDDEGEKFSDGNFVGGSQGNAEAGGDGAGMDESCDARTKKQTAEWRAKETLIDVAFEIADDDDFEKGAKEQDAGKEHEKGNDAPKNHTVAFIDKTFGNGADEGRYEIAR